MDINYIIEKHAELIKKFLESHQNMFDGMEYVFSGVVNIEEIISDLHTLTVLDTGKDTQEILNKCLEISANILFMLNHIDKNSVRLS